MTHETLKLHEAMARLLRDNGFHTLFGVMGDANLFLIDSFVRSCGGAYVSAAHEAGAAVMALGYAAASGKVGVASVTHGPAVTNTLTALVEGVKGRIPMLLICGDTAVEDRDNLQNAPQRELIIATGAGFEQLRSPHTMIEDVLTALSRAAVDRRPVAINVPVEFQWAEVAYRPTRLSLPSSRGFVPASADMDNAAGIIAAARRPILLAGIGAAEPGARAALVRLAERTGALLATTLKGKDMFRDQPFNLGIFGTLSTPEAVDAIMGSDCIMAFGASLNAFTTSQGTFLAGKRVIQCNLDPADIGRYSIPTVGLVGDAGLVANALFELLELAEIPPSGDRALVREALTSQSQPEYLDLSTATTMDLRTALIRIESSVPSDRLLVTDGGRFMLEAWKYLTVLDPRSFLLSINFGSIGLGMATAIGAARAALDRPVLLVTGDGGFMLGGLAEFNTAVRCGADLIVLVCNDASYGAEHVQFRMRGMDPNSSTFHWPEFADVADTLGGRGITVRTSEDLERAVEAIRTRDRPLLIDLKLDPDRLPSMTH